jgi:hypothetical protein
MKSNVLLISALTLCFILLGCESGKRVTKSRMTTTYVSKLELDHAIEFRPRQIPVGAATDHPCLRGDYTHVYETDNGIHGHEVWLCCVPINELLSDNFNCSDQLFLPIFGSEEYQKIRSCYLLHPTSSEIILIPVCIPAPLTAPQVDSLIQAPNN